MLAAVVPSFVIFATTKAFSFASPLYFILFFIFFCLKVFDVIYMSSVSEFALKLHRYNELNEIKKKIRFKVMKQSEKNLKRKLNGIHRKRVQKHAFPVIVIELKMEKETNIIKYRSESVR